MFSEVGVKAALIHFNKNIVVKPSIRPDIRLLDQPDIWPAVEKQYPVHP
jgi:hypothetical protein